MSALMSGSGTSGNSSEIRPTSLNRDFPAVSVPQTPSTTSSTRPLPSDLTISNNFFAGNSARPSVTTSAGSTIREGGLVLGRRERQCTLSCLHEDTRHAPPSSPPRPPPPLRRARATHDQSVISYLPLPINGHMMRAQHRTHAGFAEPAIPNAP